MKKHIISAVLAVVITFSFNLVAFASERDKNESLLNERISSFVEAKIDTINAKITVDNVKTLNDFAGNEYKLIECDPTGYFIIHPESGIIVEYAANAKSPYDGLDSNIYYGGPTYYYVKSKGNYVHTILDIAIDTNEIESTAKDCRKFNDELISQTDNSAVRYFADGNATSVKSATSKGTDYWVSSYTWLKNRTSNFGYVDGGYCGYIAANLLLKYWDYRGTIDLPSPYSTINSTALTNELIDIGDDLGYGASTWASPIANVIDEFCSQQDLPEEASWAIGVYGITTEIATNKRPCILFGNLDGAGNHAVVAYGYNEYENPGYYTYICHYGWDGDYSEVHVYGGTSIFGSNTKYKV